MPHRTLVRSSATILIVQHDSAAHFLSATFPTFRRHEESANIVFAHALKLLGSEAALTGCHFTNESDVSTWWKQETKPSQSHVAGPPITDVAAMADQNKEPFWLTVWSSPSPFAPPTLDIVLSCVSWTLGDYPIFLWTPKNLSSVTPAWLNPRLELLAEHLLDIVPPQRVFSIFGMTLLVKSFTRYWSDLVKCPIEPEPFYAACYSFCNPDTFKGSNDSLPRGDNIRRANVEDLAAVGQLCKEFADDTVCPSHPGIPAGLLGILNHSFYRYTSPLRLMPRWLKLGSLSQTASFGSTSLKEKLLLFVLSPVTPRMFLRLPRCTRRPNGDVGDLQSISSGMSPGGSSPGIVLCLALTHHALI